MKRLAILVAAVAACLLSACASTSTSTSAAATTANIVAQVKKACAVVQPTIMSLQGQTSVLTTDQLNDLISAAELADKVCTAAASATVVDTASVSDFVASAFPVVIKIVNAAPLDPVDKATASTALTVAQTALSLLLAQ